MKTIYELNEIFSNFEGNIKKYLQGSNWLIKIFRPYSLNKEIRQYHFRLYGEMSGSLFEGYNDNLQLCADVYYKYNINSNVLTREIKIRDLPDKIQCHIDIQALINRI
jgi:hypothetical protein